VSGKAKEASWRSVSCCWSSSRVYSTLPNFHRASEFCQWFTVAGWYL